MTRSLDRALTAAVAVLAVALVWVVAGTLQDRVVGVGDTAPEFKVVTDDGKTLTRSNFGGKVLVLNFWASWCAPCIDEAPSLEAFHRALAPEGVVVLAVSIDRNEKLYQRFKDRFHVTFETSRDPDAGISDSYGTFQIPETYVIDRSGKVVEKVISNQDWTQPDFVARVRRLL